MHYSLKKRLDKIDSNQYRNLKIPEIDITLNEALSLYIKIIAEPRMRSYLGFEANQRSIDDLKNIVETGVPIPVSNNIIELPDNYLFYIKGSLSISKGSCENKKASLKIRQHDDNFNSSPFDKSSFEWREVNGVFNNKGIELFTEDFTVNEAYISYIRKPLYIHNAEDYGSGSYRLLDGTVLTGTQDCELSDHTHSEIVDLAVLIISGELNLPNYQANLNKFKLNT